MAITAFLSRSSGLLNRGPGGPAALGAGSLYRIFISNSLNFLCTELYNCSISTFFLWASQIVLIQPVHGQGYILIFLDWMHLLFTQMHFLFWQLGRGHTGICYRYILPPQPTELLILTKLGLIYNYLVLLFSDKVDLFSNEKQ